jgi:hypothetical protein
LSFTDQFLARVLDPSKTLVDPIKVLPCDFTYPFTKDYQPAELQASPENAEDCGHRVNLNQVPVSKLAAKEVKKHANIRLYSSIRGSFKIPSLRNVELSGPYMHNGAFKSLEEVIDFYDRGGNVSNEQHFNTGAFPHGFTDETKANLLAFLQGLTDERVRWERAPFDHPGLKVPHGQSDVLTNPSASRGEDQWLDIPAIGQHGRPQALGPLQPFAAYLGD